MQQLHAVRPRHQLEFERRLATRLPRHANLGALGLGRNADHCPGRHQLRCKLLPLAESLHADAGRVVEVALCIDEQLVVAARELELTGRLARRASVDADLARHRQHDLEQARQRGELVAQLLAGVAAHGHRNAQLGIAFAPGHERVLAGAQQVTRAQAQARPAALEIHRLRHRVDHHLDGRRGKDQHGRECERNGREGDGDAAHRPASRRHRRSLRPEHDCIDAFALTGTIAGHAPERRGYRRRGDVVHATSQQVQHSPSALHAQLESTASHVEDVAAAQPGRARYSRAVMQDHRLLARRLDEKLSIVLRDPRERPRRRRRHHDTASLSAHRNREIRRRERSLAQRLTQDQLGVQIFSSQRIVSSGGTLPGSIVISRRTSRKPDRVPTTV